MTPTLPESERPEEEEEAAAFSAGARLDEDGGVTDAMGVIDAAAVSTDGWGDADACEDTDAAAGTLGEATAEGVRPVVTETVKETDLEKLLDLEGVLLVGTAVRDPDELEDVGEGVGEIAPGENAVGEAAAGEAAAGEVVAGEATTGAIVVVSVIVGLVVASSREPASWSRRVAEVRAAVTLGAPSITATRAMVIQKRCMGGAGRRGRAGTPRTARAEMRWAK